MKQIRVLICDDSALMRRSLTRIIEADRDLCVIGTARDGEDAVVKARDLQPDVITMDINMPVLDGITALQYIMADEIAPVIMVSSLTQEGATATFEALALGAFDFVAKPGGTVSANLDSVARELHAKIHAAAGSGTMNRLLKKKQGLFTEKAAKTDGKKPARTRLRERTKPASTPVKAAPSTREKDLPDFKAVALGVSTGGPKTLYDVLPLLPPDLNAAVMLVQHMPPKFITSFAQRINQHCQMQCVEAEAGMEVEPGTIYIGTGGLHLTLFKKLSKKVIIRTPARPDHMFIPSVDVMMQSVLEVFGTRTIGVLMTGMGDDGAQSMVDITRAGCITIAENEESAIVFGMPKEAIERGGARIVVPSWDIAGEIIKAVKYS